MNDIGQVLKFPFVDLPLTDVDVDVTVFLKGDLALSSQYYQLGGDNLSVGSFGRFSTLSQCAESFEQGSRTIESRKFNLVVGDRKWDLEMIPRNIDPSKCVDDNGDQIPDGSQVYIEISYMYCILPSSEPSLTPSSAIELFV